MNQIPAGMAFLAGRSRENARAALAAAEAAGFEPSSVRTQQGGYLLPEKALEFLELEGDDSVEVVTDDSDGEEADGETTETGEAATETTSETETTTEVVTEVPEVVEVPEIVEVPQPPKSGSGSGEEAWIAWAKDAKGYDPAEGLSRNEIIARYGA